MEKKIKRQKAKGKHQKGGGIGQGAPEMSTAHFCLLMFAFCLLISPWDFH
jgi:hypothetical protein